MSMYYSDDGVIQDGDTLEEVQEKARKHGRAIAMDFLGTAVRRQVPCEINRCRFFLEQYERNMREEKNASLVRLFRMKITMFASIIETLRIHMKDAPEIGPEYRAPEYRDKGRGGEYSMREREIIREWEKGRRDECMGVSPPLHSTCAYTGRIRPAFPRICPSRENGGGAMQGAEGATRGSAGSVKYVSSLTSKCFRSHDVCVMCGVLLANDEGRRSKTVRTFLGMLENRWRKTPYMWAVLNQLVSSAASPNERLTACTACINWIRRSVVRNYYLAILPEHLRLALQESGGDVNQCIRRVVLRWFNDVNNRSPIFRHPDTAYVVRKALGWTGDPLREEEEKGEGAEQTADEPQTPGYTQTPSDAQTPMYEIVDDDEEGSGEEYESGVWVREMGVCGMMGSAGITALKGPASQQVVGNSLVYTLEVEDRGRMAERLSELEDIVRLESLSESPHCGALQSASYKGFQREALAWARGYRPVPPGGCHFPANLGYVTFIGGRLSYILPLPDAPKGEPMEDRYLNRFTSYIASALQVDVGKIKEFLHDPRGEDAWYSTFSNVVWSIENIQNLAIAVVDGAYPYIKGKKKSYDGTVQDRVLRSLIYTNVRGMVNTLYNDRNQEKIVKVLQDVSIIPAQYYIYSIVGAIAMHFPGVCERVDPLERHVDSILKLLRKDDSPNAADMERAEYLFGIIREIIWNDLRVDQHKLLTLLLLFMNKNRAKIGMEPIQLKSSGSSILPRVGARIPLRATASEGEVRAVEGAKLPFVGALQIVCRRKGLEHNIIEHAIAWVSCRNSYSAVPMGGGVFLVSGDLATAELQHLQVMAVAAGPSVAKLVSIGAPPNVKDIHMGTGRLPLRAVLEMAVGGEALEEGESSNGFMSVGFDPVQPDVEIVVRAVPLPGGLGGKFSAMNRTALGEYRRMEDKLIPMGQDRINRYNMQQNVVALNFCQEMERRGIKRHPEGVMSGLFVSSIGNTLVDVLTNMDVIMQEKIRISRTTALDAFGITALLFRMTGLSAHDRVDERVAADCLANVGGLFASDLTYASDVKPLLPEKRPQDLKPLLDRSDGEEEVVVVYEDSGMGSGMGSGSSRVGSSMKALGRDAGADARKNDLETVPAYAMSEDIMVPFSDIFLRMSHAQETLFNHLSDTERRGYLEGLRSGDCEDLSHMGILGFSYMRRFCVRLSSKCGVIYDEYPELERMTKEAFAEEVYRSIRAQEEVKDWTDDELRGVIRQCGEFGEHLHDTSMRAVLMTAKAAKMSATGKPMNMPPAGHCAAMIVRGRSSVEAAARSRPETSLTSGMENQQSSYDRILTEMTTAVRIESFVGREEVTGKPASYVSQKIRANGGLPNPLSEATFYNKCTMFMAPTREMKPWMHIGKLDGIFWHVVSTIGDTMLLKHSTVGVPITEAVSSTDKELRGIKVDFTEAERQETLMMARYALPPIESNTALIGRKLDRPLPRCIYGPNTIPIGYIVEKRESPEIAAWVAQNPAQRYLVNLGSKTIAVHQMNKCAMKGLRETLMKQDRVNIVDSV
ncbi:hypothetical protein GUITHDRAFT_147755 [Guillardia theta CCMP2712]|uniref:Uncharacterized protein n=1 Tax=Guillardia theta (strain CCMP2712) TaxID=905079 RepID=L1ICR0_GUITC|nr:hypothetical protein GUITHDRAFT_147755 [Guillardia theta CCMP2712]EKX33625.1 hypothetical protein GUITHDRAFT_147755 [Guillardia theta CCMP2712]|eukprot:XP_005820605.1 hypothetical protein GUITHDRAFT_147755 [Guillardia theta CCMP2712]